MTRFGWFARQRFELGSAVFVATSWGQPALPESSAPFELSWSAPATCPDVAAVDAAIFRHLGRERGGELGAGLRVALVAAQQDDGLWRTTITFDGPRGQTVRELGDATDCARAVEAASLVVAIAIDPALLLGPEPAPTPAPKPEPTPEPTPEPEPEPEPTFTGAPVTPPIAPRPPRRRLRGAIGLAAGPGFGELPRVGGTARLHAAILRPRWRVEIGGDFAGAPPQPEGAGSIAIVRWSVDARGCGVVRAGTRFEFIPCAGLEVGQSIARSLDIARTARRSDPWLGAVAAARFVFVVRPRFALFAGGDLVVPMFRRGYAIDGLGLVHRPRPVTGTLVAGAEVRFP